MDETVSTIAAAADEPALLGCAGLHVDVAGRRLVSGLNLTVRRGSVTCVLGCNGAGKTLTLHTLAGLRAPAAGEVRIAGQPLDRWPRRQLARQLGLLMQNTEDSFPSTVIETVLVGRHPHIGFWQWENDADRGIARSALAEVGMQEFESRDIATLSGGERRRVAIAAALAQCPDLLLFDEPINHLDLHHQIEVLRLFRSRAEAGHGIVMSLHDAGLAARFADQSLLLFGNGEWLSGPTEQILTEETITRLYGTPVIQLAWAQGRTFVAR